MKTLLPFALVLTACASGSAVRQPSSEASTFFCTGDSETAPRTAYLTPVHDGSKLKLEVRYHYATRKGVPDDPYYNEFSYTADWVRPELGSDPKQVTFVYDPHDYGGTYEKIVVPANELASGKIRNVQIFESSNPVKGQGGEGTLECKPQ